MQILKSLNIDNIKKRKLLFLCGSFFLVIIILVSLVSVSLAAPSATESIEILSEKVNYENKEQGSWKIKKSANWLTKGKVKITYNIDTKAMIKAKNVDLLLVVNTSNSLTNEQFSLMKSDLSKFSDSILKDGSSSRMSLLSFNSTYNLVSDFTSDKATITSGIDGLTMASGSSYYKGFQGIDTVLSNYQQAEDNKLVVIFLTNALPNKDMPNEKAQYNYLKNKYSNLIINAIAYDIGSFVPDKVKEVSDNQFNATSDTLNSALINAADMQFNYEGFTIEDYIDTDNFSLDNLDSLKATYGDVSLDTDSTGKKVLINLNDLVSGNKVKISYEMNLNSDKLDAGGLFIINKNIKAKSAIGEVIEDVSSDKTPVVADNYKVSYISNAPDGCSVGTLPDSAHYSVFDTVKMTDNLVCDGYQFRGWELVSNKNVTMINSNNFLMPEDDVVIKGTWSKLSVSKSMDGTVYTPQTLNDIIANQAVLDNIRSTYVTADTGIDFSKASSDTNGKGVYTMASTKDDEFPIHYYRGAVTNNHVKYAGYCWKIVRTTETGGVKLVYNGTPSTSGSCGGLNSNIGQSTFNENNNSITDVGYMYGDSQENVSRKMDDTWYGLNDHSRDSIARVWYIAAGKTESRDSGVSSTAVGNKKYYFASNYTYDSSTNMYTLSNPSKEHVNLLHTAAKGKYTCHSTSSTSCASLGYVLDIDTGSYNYISLTGGETLDSLQQQADKVRWLYGKSVTYDETTGNYTLNDTTESKHISLATNYSEIVNGYPYTCSSTSDTCSSVMYLDEDTSDTVYYVSMSGGETYDSLYANAITDQYTYMYGNDAVYDEATGMYTLTDPISSHLIDWSKDKSKILSNHHYFCTDNQTSCSTVNYAYYSDNANLYYFSFSDGKNKDNILENMHVNQQQSNAKTILDAWYSANLTKYSAYLEDTVWCNDRELASKAGLEINNDISASGIKFSSSDRFEKASPSLLCTNNADKFTVSSSIGNGLLSYPIGLLTLDEYLLSGVGSTSSYSTSSLKPQSNAFTLSPYSFDAVANNSVISSSGEHKIASKAYFSPAISLRAGLMVYAGDGSGTRPYILESFAKKVVIEGNDDIKASPGAVLPGDKVSLLSKSGLYKVNSFKLNGEVINGSEFIAPDADILITDIVVEGVITIKGNSDIKASVTSALGGVTITLSSKSGDYVVNSFKLNGKTITGSEFVMPDTEAIITDIVVEGVITVSGNDDIVASATSALAGSMVTLSSKSGDYVVSSFKLNGKTVSGTEFVMPDTKAVITDIKTKGIIVISGNDDIKASATSASSGSTITLSSKSGKYLISSFKLNGKTITGTKFTMPDTKAVITDIIVEGIITVNGNDDIIASVSSALAGSTVTLSSRTGRYKINSFKLNGTLINGSEFTMPDTEAVITDISVERIPDAIYESEHNPYPSSMNKKVYADKTFTGAKSLTVTIDYETQKTAIAPDYIYIYDGDGNDISGKLKGKRTTKTFTIPGNHIKITFTSDAVLNNYYGFRAVVIANYD